jgi:hypothetical protein
MKQLSVFSRQFSEKRAQPWSGPRRRRADGWMVRFWLCARPRACPGDWCRR